MAFKLLSTVESGTMVIYDYTESKLHTTILPWYIQGLPLVHLTVCKVLLFIGPQLLMQTTEVSGLNSQNTFFTSSIMIKRIKLLFISSYWYHTCCDCSKWNLKKAGSISCCISHIQSRILPSLLAGVAWSSHMTPQATWI